MYAGEPTNKWGSITWGSSVWGWRDVEWTFNKYVPTSFALASSLSKNISHLISESLVLGILISRDFAYRVYDSFSMTSKIASVYVINNGWVVAKGGQSNALNWPRDSFSDVANATTTWSDVTATSTTWVQS
jgi:hypothetical protein